MSAYNNLILAEKSLKNISIDINLLNRSFGIGM